MTTSRVLLGCLALLSVCASGACTSSEEQGFDPVVVKMLDDTIASIHLRRDADYKEVLTAYPNGRFLAWTNHDKLVANGMSFDEYTDFMAHRKKPRSPAPQGAYNTGLPVGYDPSLGPSGTTCFNFNSQVAAAPTTSLSFSSQNTASSSAAQTNVSASIKGSAYGFNASDTFSFSDSYQNSANSGNIYFDTYVIYTLQNVYDSSNPLNAFGQMFKNDATQFVQNCGSNFITVVPAGMLAYGQLSYSSSSSQAAQAISDTFKASYGLDSLSVAVSAAKQVANSSTQMDFSLTVMGGGENAIDIIVQAYNNESTDLSKCVQGTPSNCDNFAVALNAAFANAAAAFQKEVTSPLPSDISFFEPFPNGVHGVSTDALMYLSIANIVAGATDLYQQYKTQLDTYVGLLNQIGTLYNRAYSLFGKVYGTSFDPQQLLSISGYLSSLQTTYQADRATLINNLLSCLGSVSQCGPVINNNIVDAYTWYGTGGGNPNFKAQQNSVALQYAGIYNDSQSDSYPNDTVYMYQLPTFQSPAQNISGMAALTAFADATYYAYGASQNGPSAILLPLPVGVDIGHTYSEADMTYYGIYSTGWSPGTGAQSLEWITPPCQPSFQNPCSLGYKWKSGSTGVTLTAIPNFFTTP